MSMAALDRFSHRWGMLGIFLFMMGFFIAPSASAHKTIFYWLVLLPGLLFAIPHGLKWLKDDFLFAGVLLLLAYLTSAVLWSPDISSYSAALKPVLFIVLWFFVLFWLAASVAEQQLVFKVAVLFSCCVIGGWFLIEHFLSAKTFDDLLALEWRYANRNRMAKVFGFSAVMGCLVFYAERHLALRLLAVAAVVVSLLIVSLSKSTGAVLAVLGVSLLVGVYCSRHIFKWSPKLLLISVTVLLCLIAITYESGFLELIGKGGWSKRDQIWLAILYEAPQFLWFGQGLLEDASVVGLDGYRYGHEHNVFMAILRQSGVVGLLGFCGVLATVIWKVIQSKSSSVKFWGVLLVYGVFALLSGGKYPLQRPTEAWLLLWVPLAFVILFISLERKDCVLKAEN
jgi:O-Antigen ligase